MNTAELSKGDAASDSAPHQVLSFCLAEETYGVDILRVKEIRRWTPVTRLPHTPAQVLGVLNLRGSIVPIVDLRVQFNLQSAEFTPLTVIVVLSIKVGNGRREVGLVVDSVSDVVDIDAAQLKAAPNLASNVSERFIRGLVTVAERMMILLDVDELIRNDLAQAALDSAA